ncbi:glycosyltransferase family 2 protein [Candidatus Pelagibacter sp.]|jgi:polyisoprenyl-phosphate glycosyltransferase|nr:glycosyltransferase family 2 protein [Candidatus Pelagibacter sp.]
MKNIKDLKISSVVACYKDEQSIPLMHKRLTDVFQKIGCSYEIIFVNDGSPDDSEKILENICQKDHRTTAIFHSRNFDSQNAFTSGMLQSIGDAVILLDGDLQDPPEVIEDFVKKWLDGYDVVYGSRINRDTSKIMNYAYKTFYRIFNKLSYLEIPLDAGDFSLMDRKVVNEINNAKERDRFIRGLRAWVGFKQIGVPYHRPDRLFGKSTNNFVKNIRWAKKGIFSFSYLPLEFMSFFSYIMVLISGLALLFYVIAYLFNQEAPEGITTLIVLVLFFGGVQLLSISILSEYIGKILEETKKRPSFIVKKILNNKKK